MWLLRCFYVASSLFLGPSAADPGGPSELSHALSPGLMLASRHALLDFSLQIVSRSDRRFLKSRPAHQENLRGPKSQRCWEHFRMKVWVIQVILQFGTQSAPLR